MALGAVAGPQDLPALVAFTRSCSDETALDSAAGAIARLCKRIGNLEAQEPVLMSELSRATDPRLRNCWLDILVRLGSPKALPALKTDLHGTNDQVAAEAIALLASWSDPAPVEDLLAVAESNPNPGRRAAALEAAVRLAATAADEKQRPDDTIVEWLGRADKLAQDTKERWMVLGGLGRVKNIESFRLLARHLADPDVEKEAGLPMVAMARDLAKQGQATEVKATLDKLAETAKNEDLRTKARTAAEGL